MRLPRSDQDNPNGSRLQEKRFSDFELKGLVRKMGLKVTSQRIEILKALSKKSQHTSAQEIYERVKHQYPEIGFATVYRFLKSLSDHQFVNEVRRGGLPAQYELKSARHHDHMSCIECGRIVEFENIEIEMLQERVAKDHGFKLTGHVLEIYGVCPKCLERTIR